MTDVHIFNTKTHTLSRVAQENKQRIVPVLYPCVRTLRDTIVTADIYSHEIVEFNSKTDQVRVVAQMPSELTDDSE